MNAQLTNQIVQFVKLASVFAARASAELSAAEAAKVKAAAAIPSLVDRMVETKAIDPATRKEAQALLGDHYDSLGFIGQALEKLAQLKNTQSELMAKTASLGGPAPSGSSPRSEPSARSPFVGRRTREKSAADEAFETILHESR